jgi:hypothetical protein
MLQKFENVLLGEFFGTSFPLFKLVLLFLLCFRFRVCFFFGPLLFRCEGGLSLLFCRLSFIKAIARDVDTDAGKHD